MIILPAHCGSFPGTERRLLCQPLTTNPRTPAAPAPGSGEPGSPDNFRAIFIRAPAVLKTGKGVEVLAELPLPERFRAAHPEHQGKARCVFAIAFALRFTFTERGGAGGCAECFSFAGNDARDRPSSRFSLRLLTFLRWRHTVAALRATCCSAAWCALPAL